MDIFLNAANLTEAAIKEKLDRLADLLGSLTIAQARQLLVEAKKGDPGLSYSVETMSPYERVVALVAAAGWARYVYFGRLPGRLPPPYRPILEWATKKGLTPRHPLADEGASMKRMSIAIAQSIGRMGIPAMHFFDMALDQIRAKAEQIIIQNTIVE